MDARRNLIPIYEIHQTTTYITGMKFHHEVYCKAQYYSYEIPSQLNTRTNKS